VALQDFRATVLYLTDNPTLGGTIRILQSWLLLAPGRGVQPCVVTPPGSRFAEWLDAHAIPRAESEMPWLNARRPWRTAADIFRVGRWAKARGVQVVHCNEHNVYPYGAWLARWLRVPIVCHMRYIVGADFARWAFGGRRAPDALLWTSRQQREDCAEAMAGVVPDERQHLVPLGLDLAQFGTRLDEREPTRRRWNVAPDQVVVGQACALRARKRLEEFIGVVTGLAERDPRVVGVLAGDAMPGDEAYRDRLQRLVAEPRYRTHVKLLGNIDDIEPFYQGIDIAVSTSEYETFGNSVCEAMACGRPVVGYTGGSVAEVVGDTGRIVATGDTAALSSAIETLVDNAALRSELGAAARTRVRDEYSPARSFEQVSRIYETLVH
jgi:glycosyltransferase involved in cell wall biosynthesis